MKRYYLNLFNCISRIQVYFYLADCASRKSFRGVVRARKSPRKKALQLYQCVMYPGAQTQYHFTAQDGHKVYGNENMYFIQDYFSFNEQTVLLDAGAFIGDSIREYVKYAGEFGRAYCIEPDIENFKALQQTVERSPYGDKISLFTVALAKQNGEACFSVSGSGSRIYLEGSVSIKTVHALEFIESLNPKPTFIKMDIEGSELDVLNSIQPFIKREKPDMAISIYHETEHLWRIPLLLHQIVPDYQIYIRHNSNDFTETVCYATKY